MSFNEVLAELPGLTVAERQVLVRQVLALDESMLSPADEALVERRLADHRANPASAMSLEEMETRLRARFAR